MILEVGKQYINRVGAVWQCVEFCSCYGNLPFKLMNGTQTIFMRADGRMRDYIDSHYDFVAEYNL